jgi:DNA polymerase (family 10)
MPYIPPEIRENRGEIEAALTGQLPDLIGYGDLKGDLHVHCNWNGGANSIEEIVEAALPLGYDYVGISDHTKYLKIERGLDEDQLIARNKEIDQINDKLSKEGKDFRVLKGCEANILADGSIDINDEVLAQLDYVIAGVHSHFRLPKDEMTKRILTAMHNPHVDIISHPTGRIIKRREEYEVVFDDMLQVAKETGTILEINSYPERLDLGDVNIHAAKQLGVRMVINTDTHNVSQLHLMKFGISQARRGWAEKKDIINAWPVEKLLQMMK